MSADSRPDVTTDGWVASALATFPTSPIDHDNVAFYAGLLERRLLANRCAPCGWWHFPHRPVCPRCWSSDVVATPVAGTGSVYMLTRLHHVPWRGIGLDPPVVIATVELDEQAGLRVSAPVLDGSERPVDIGDRVRLDWYTNAGVPTPAFRADRAEVAP